MSETRQWFTVPQRAASRKAFHELLDLLREVDERYAGSEWGIEGPDEIVGTLRAVLHMLEASLVTRTECCPAMRRASRHGTTTRTSAPPL